MKLSSGTLSRAEFSDQYKIMSYIFYNTWPYSYTPLPTMIDNKDPVNHVYFSGLHKEIELIEYYLGLNPQSSFKDVASRLDNLATVDATPKGVISMFGGAAAPTGWLLCNGAAISRTTYAALFTAIGTAYGTGDGSTTFNVPDLKGKVPAGYNSAETEFNTLGKTGGEKTHTLSVAEMPAHKHKHTEVTSGGSGYNGLFATNTGHEFVNYNYISDEGGNGAHNNLQPYIALNFIIKY